MTVRCAIYTRKSSEEGLEQDFNSLDAQRQAGLDYIASQKAQGWMPLPDRYDDGGVSGGTIDRPALKRLLADAALGRIDTVVVYKVDRLSRSLTDFARLMQLFDEHGVTFVSVTQQFSTTSSMGRLTLNMLLSFAQFEREVAGERIRDKIAATKKQGIWVCGQPPLGYRLPAEGEDRRLRIVDAEAAIVKAMFEGYLELGSPLAVAQRLDQQGHRARRWQSSTGRWHGGGPLHAKAVHRALTNPVYLGKITHTFRDGRTEVYQGRHEAIIDQDLWDRVHAQMKSAQRETATRWTHTHLLKGKLRTHEGYAMSPSTTQSKSKGGRIGHIRYYVSQKAIREGFASCPIKSMNAGFLDNLVRAVVVDHLRAEHRVDLGPLESSQRDHLLRAMIQGVELAPDRLLVRLDPVRVTDSAAHSILEAVNVSGGPVPRCPLSPRVDCRSRHVELSLAIQVKKLDGKRILLGPEGQDLLLTVDASGQPIPKPELVTAIGQAFMMRNMVLDRGMGVKAVARELGYSHAFVSTMLSLTQVGPQMLHDALFGDATSGMTVLEMLRRATSLDWSRQQAACHGAVPTGEAARRPTSPDA